MSAGLRNYVIVHSHGAPGRPMVIFAVVLGLLGLAVSAASVTLLLSYKSTAQAQISQLQRAVAGAVGQPGHRQRP